MRTSRPRFWVYTAGPWMLGAFAGASEADRFLSWPFWVGLATFLFPANVFIYGINDIFDFETDRINSKKSHGEIGYERFLPISEHRETVRAILWSNLPAMGALLFAAWQERSLLAAVFLVAFCFFSHGYSATPIRAKARPGLDSSFNILYACPGFLSFFLMGGHADYQLPFILAGAWLWCMAMHAFSAVPDIDADREAGVPTVATWLGAKGTLIACGVCYGSAALLLALTSAQWTGGLVAAALLGLAYAAMVGWAAVGLQRHGVFGVYRVFPLVNAGCGFLLTMLVLWNRWPVLRP